MPKILLVDDSPNILELFATVLSKAGFDVMCAADGREARQHLAAGDFDGMVTDLVMPDFEGLALISGAKLLYPRLRIIAISGAFGGEFLHTAELMGAHLALGKPIRPEMLVQAVSDVLAMN